MVPEHIVLVSKMVFEIPEEIKFKSFMRYVNNINLIKQINDNKYSDGSQKKKTLI